MQRQIDYEREKHGFSDALSAAQKRASEEKGL